MKRTLTCLLILLATGLLHPGPSWSIPERQAYDIPHGEYAGSGDGDEPTSALLTAPAHSPQPMEYLGSGDDDEPTKTTRTAGGFSPTMGPDRRQTALGLRLTTGPSPRQREEFGERISTLIGRLWRMARIGGRPR